MWVKSGTQEARIAIAGLLVATSSFKMSTISLGGAGFQSVGFGSNGSFPRNVQLLSVGDSSFTARYEIFAEGRWLPLTSSYFFDGINLTRILSFSDDGRYFADIVGGDLGTLNEYASATNPVAFAETIEIRFLSQDNVFIGSKDGGSVIARLLGGNDYAEIHSGNNNFLNGNSGFDDIVIFGGAGRVLGGSEDDYIEINGGQFEKINGNRGNDYIVNYADFQVNVRGGSENDTIVSAAGSMNAYGDLGADTFVPLSGGFMIVKDYIPGFDSVDLSYLQPDYLIYQTESGLGVGDGFGPALLLEGVNTL